MRDHESRQPSTSAANAAASVADITDATNGHTRTHANSAADTAGAGPGLDGSRPGSDGPEHAGPRPRPGANGDTILCEEIAPLACTGPAEAPQWLSPEEGERLLAAEPERNLLPTAIEQQLDVLLPTLPGLQVALESVANERAEAQRAAHERVRAASRARRISRAGAGRGGRIAVEPVLPVDILGAYVLLPVLPAVAGTAPG